MVSITCVLFWDSPNIGIGQFKLGPVIALKLVHSSFGTHEHHWPLEAL
jgi:hypothetical protein